MLVAVARLDPPRALVLLLLYDLLRNRLRRRCGRVLRVLEGLELLHARAHDLLACAYRVVLMVPCLLDGVVWWPYPEHTYTCHRHDLRQSHAVDAMSTLPSLSLARERLHAIDATRGRQKDAEQNAAPP